MENDRDKALDAVAEAFESFIGYNRDHDPSLPTAKLFRLIREGFVTKADIVAEFHRNIDPDEREQVLDAVTEVSNDLFFYDRKTDETLTRDKLQQLIREGVVTHDEIVAEFRRLIKDLDVNIG